MLCIIKFTHAYDTTGGSRIFRVWVVDDDTLVSANRDTSFTVRKGAPALWGDSGDTLFMVINNGPGVYYRLKVNSLDTNGIIGKYFWNESGAGLTNADSTDKDTLSRRVVTLEINKAWPEWIYGRDDDGFLRGGKFTVFADSAPPKPSIVAIPITDSTKILWSGKDTKDGSATQYRILLKQGSAPAATDIVQDFKAGTQYLPGESGADFEYIYKAGIKGSWYYYQVVSRDARNTITMSDVGTFIFQ